MSWNPQLLYYSFMVRGCFPSVSQFIRETLFPWPVFHIKLCLLLQFEFSKTMALLLSVLRDFSVRCRKITVGLNQIQSAHSW